jgi:ribose transport system substrate-binding protein
MAGAAAALAAWGINPAFAEEAVGRSGKPLRAAFSNAGLQATWCAQGKQAAEYWGKLFNVEVTWFDGELAAQKQRAAIDNMASQKWDFVAIQAFGIGTLTAPVNKMIDAGVPVIDMDTLIAPLDSINVHSFLAPDNEFMGASVTQAGGRDRRRRHHDHDSGCARPHWGAGSGAGFPVGGEEISEDRGTRHPAG